MTSSEKANSPAGVEPDNTPDHASNSSNAPEKDAVVAVQDAQQADSSLKKDELTPVRSFLVSIDNPAL